jgi:hypothetical protein
MNSCPLHYRTLTAFIGPILLCARSHSNIGQSEFPATGIGMSAGLIAATLEKMKMSVFGFSTEPSSGGDFLPIAKYDARSGRMFRIDRVDTGSGFVSDAVDITATFKAIVDFENIEVGWIDFPVGSAPNFSLVPMGTQLPDRPSAKHKNGVRFMLKLSKDCGGAKPIRELAGTSKAFLSGIEAVFTAYQTEKSANPGKLPVIVLEKTTPIKSGSGATVSTNYQPTFRISGWAPRGDLVFQPKTTHHTKLPDVQFGSAPATGSTKVDPPGTAKPQPAMAEDDFG